MNVMFFRSKVAQIANLDPSWALQGNGLNHQQPGLLRLFLAACKLLDLALVLPADMLPQFQLYLLLGFSPSDTEFLSSLAGIDGLSLETPLNLMTRGVGSRTKFHSSPHTSRGLRNS